MKKIDFRDGEREVPDYIGALLGGIDTQNLTYKEAIDISNRSLLTKRLNLAQHDLVNDHMRNLR